jgi:hypothetical protein
MVLISPAKKIHIGKGRNFGGVGVPDNVIRVKFYGTSFTWGLINNTANYTVDYGDSTTYNGVSGSTLTTQTKTYSSAGFYDVDFIFNDIDDVTRFELSNFDVGGYVTDIINLEDNDVMNRLILSNNDIRMPQLTITGAIPSASPRHEFHTTNIVRADYSGASFLGNLVFLADNCDELIELLLPSLTGDGNLLRIGDNPKITSLDMTGDGIYAYGTYDIGGCPLLESVTMSSSDNTTRNTTVTANNLPSATGTLDLRRFKRLRSTVNLNTNTWDEILFPVLSGVGSDITSLFIDNSDNITELDISGLGSNILGTFRSHSCPNLASVTFPSTTRDLTCELHLCDITGVMNVSPMTGLSSIFRVEQNSNLTNITFGTSATSTVFSIFYFHTCNITGIQDLSPLTNLSGLVQGYSNPLMTEVVLPASSEAITQMLFYDCALETFDITPLTGTLNGISIRVDGCVIPTADVNQLLIDLDAKGWTGGNLNVSGGTNGAPTGAGITARNNLIGKGWTVTTN